LAAPVGRPTRGTTGSNRLRRFDRWIAHLVPELRRGRPLIVDLGFGADPRTTLEWQRGLHRLNPGVRVVGVEIDAQRVAAADGLIEAVRGGFEIPTDHPPLVIRAANVLRQYDRDEVRPAWDRMCARLASGGWLVEGTCDEQGRLTTMVSLDGSGPRWFTVSCRLAGLQAPSEVAARLPKALIHDNVPGTAINALLQDMDAEWQRAPRFGARQRWIAMAEALAPRWQVRDGRGRWRLGELTVPWESVGGRAIGEPCRSPGL
jgi:hypothetical protein